MRKRRAPKHARVCIQLIRGEMVLRLYKVLLQGTFGRFREQDKRARMEMRRWCGRDVAVEISEDDAVVFHDPAQGLHPLFHGFLLPKGPDVFDMVIELCRTVKSLASRIVGNAVPRYSPWSSHLSSNMRFRQPRQRKVRHLRRTRLYPIWKSLHWPAEQ